LYDSPPPKKVQPTLSILPGRYAVCRVNPTCERLPGFDQGSLVSITRRGDELSIVLAEESDQPDWLAECGWRAIQVEGPLDFSLTGILASLAAPLAQAGISIFAISTYDTDLILVRDAALPSAVAILQAAGFSFLNA